MDDAIVLKHVSKVYRLFSNKRNKLIELLLINSQMALMHALRDISFTVKKGECIGLLGLNGSGKSTLANLISGISTPSEGEIIIQGEASCVSVKTGLNAELTGLENIEYKGLLLGFSPHEIKEVMPNIIEFADIGDYIHQPIKYYSSGMSARLGFAISINVNPDILVIDEGLSVGDPSFTDKCMNAMNKYREMGKTIVFVSHSLPTVESFCSKALWLEYGSLKMIGETKNICAEYKDFMSMYNKMNTVEKDEYKKAQIMAQARYSNA